MKYCWILIFPLEINKNYRESNLIDLSINFWICVYVNCVANWIIQNKIENVHSLFVQKKIQRNFIVSFFPLWVGKIIMIVVNGLYQWEVHRNCCTTLLLLLVFIRFVHKRNIQNKARWEEKIENKIQWNYSFNSQTIIIVHKRTGICVFLFPFETIKRKWKKVRKKTWEA